MKKLIDFKNLYLIFGFLTFILFLTITISKTKSSDQQQCRVVKENTQTCFIGPNWNSNYGTCGRECKNLLSSEMFKNIGGNPDKAWSSWAIRSVEYKCTSEDPAPGSNCIKKIFGEDVIFICYRSATFANFLCSTGDKYDTSVPGIWKNGYLNCGLCSLTQNCNYCREPYKVCCTAEGRVASSRSQDDDGLSPLEGYCAGGAVKSAILKRPVNFEPSSGDPHEDCGNVILSCQTDPPTPQIGQRFTFIASTGISEPPPIRWRDCSGPNFNCDNCSGNQCTVDNAQGGDYKATAYMVDNTGREIASTTCFVSVRGRTTRPPQTKILCEKSFGTEAGLCNVTISLIATGTNIKSNPNNQEEKVVDPDDNFNILYKIWISGKDAIYKCQKKRRSSWCDEPPFETSYNPGCNRSNVPCGEDDLGRTVFCEDIEEITITNPATCNLNNQRTYVTFSGVSYKIENKNVITKSGDLPISRFTGGPSTSTVVASGTIPFQTKKQGVVTFEMSATAQNQNDFNGWSGECLNNICQGVNGATNCTCRAIGTETVKGVTYTKYFCSIAKETDTQTRTTRCSISLISRAVDLVPQKPRIEGSTPSLSGVKHPPKPYIAGWNYTIIGEIIQNIKDTFNLGINNKDSYQGGGGYYEGGNWGIQGSVDFNSNLDDKGRGGSWRGEINFSPQQAGIYTFQTWHRGDDEFYFPRDEEKSNVLTINVYRYLCYQGFCWECPQEPERVGTVLKIREAGCAPVDDALCQNFGYPYRGSCKGKGRE